MLLYSSIPKDNYRLNTKREKDINQKTTETSSTTTRDKDTTNQIKNQKTEVASTTQITHSKTRARVHTFNQNHAQPHP